MRRIIVSALALVVLAACSHNAITGSNQLLLVSDGEMQTMSLTEYQKLFQPVRC